MSDDHRYTTESSIGNRRYQRITVIFCLSVASFLVFMSKSNTSMSLENEPVVEKKFSYNITNNKDCVKPQLVIGISKAIEELYEKHNIRVIPRNGFLLGIIRHGGFLPNEDIDDDLGILYTDLIGLIDRNKTTNSIRIGNYTLSPKHTQKHWVNWKGVDPVMREPYSFFGVEISRGEFSNLAYSIYQYHDNNTFFYPRCNIANFNHEAHMKDMLRYNPEGGNYRILDTDELLNKTNSQVRGQQIGTVFHITNGCLVKKQFYFTTIYVPCDSELILEAFYGRYWRNVENRGKKGGNPKIESTKLSDEENLQTLKGGPKPLCNISQPLTSAES